MCAVFWHVHTPRYLHIENRPYIAYNRTANQVYDMFNTVIFKGRLPKVPVLWKMNRSDQNSCLGYTRLDSRTKQPLTIHLNPRYRYDSKVWAQTLLHEMVHVEQCQDSLRWPHGRKFKLRMRKIVAQGFYDDLF